MSELTINNGSNNSYLEQAAILLLCLGEEAAATVMQKLSREEVVRLSENMARLSGVKTSMAKKVINNFFDEFREQSGINGASRSMLQGILNKALGTEIASSVINGIYGDEIRSRMARLQWVEPRQLAILISEEHLQLQAVLRCFKRSPVKCIRQRTAQRLYILGYRENVADTLIGAVWGRETLLAIQQRGHLWPAQ